MGKCILEKVKDRTMQTTLIIVTNSMADAELLCLLSSIPVNYN